MAASASGIRAGRAYVEIGAQLAPLQKGLKAAQARLRAFGSTVRGIGLAVAGVGTAALAPIGAAVTSFTSRGDQLDKTAARTGLTTEALSELGHAAELSGSSFADLETGIRMMQRNIGLAKEGFATSEDALARFGLTAEELQSLHPDDQLAAIAEGMQSIQDPAERAAAAMLLFGRSGTKLIPLLMQGAAGIDALRARAKQLGLSMSAEDAKAAAVFNDALTDLKASIIGASDQIGAALAPALTDLADKASTAIVAVSNFIKENRGLVVGVATTAAAIIGIGGALVGIGLTATVIAAAIGGLVTAISAVAGAVGLLLSPIGLAAAGLVGLGAAVVYLSDTSGQALTGLRGDVQSAMGGIADALAAGDLTAAARVLWAGLKLLWQTGVAALKEVWAGFAATMQSTMVVVEVTIREIWDDITTSIAKAINRISTLAKQALSKLSQISSAAGLLLSGDAAGAASAFVSIANSQSAGEAAGREGDATSKLLSDERAARGAERGRELFDRIARIEAEKAKAIQGITSALEDPRAELATAVEAAAQARLNAEGARVGPPRPRDLTPPELNEELAGELQRQAFAVRGTFNAAATQALAGGATSLQERTAKATEKTAALLQRGLDSGSGPLFTE